MFFSRVVASARSPLALDRGLGVPDSAGTLTGLLAFFKRCAARLVERLAQRPAEHLLRVEERLALGGKKSVLLFSCGGRRFLLASSGDALTPLVEVLPPEVRPLEVIPMEGLPPETSPAEGAFVQGRSR